MVCTDPHPLQFGTFLNAMAAMPKKTLIPEVHIKGAPEPRNEISCQIAAGCKTSTSASLRRSATALIFTLGMVDIGAGAGAKQMGGMNGSGGGGASGGTPKAKRHTLAKSPP
eukprot:2736097-Amphidinium_carterae.1